MSNIPGEQFYPEVVRVVSGDLTGSGFMIHPDHVGGTPGIGVSNAHVMGTGSNPYIYPIYNDNKPLRVNLLALSHEYDIAFFQIPEDTRKQITEHLQTHYECDEIPSLRLADISTLQIGDPLTAIGHPLGYQHQEFSYGHFKGAQDWDASGSTILFTSTALNGGNSGGAVVDQNRQVVGIASLKLTGEHISNMNGVRPASQVKELIPQLMNLIRAENIQKAEIQRQVAQKLGAQATELVQQGLQHNIDESFEAAFIKTAAGGKVRGQPRPFHIWCKRHVLNGAELLDGGMELLNYVAHKVHTNAVEDCTRARIEAGGWIELREQLANAGEQKNAPVPTVNVAFEPVELHLPIVGITSHPLHTDGEVRHYGHNPTDITGGVLVASVLPKSLFQKANGQVGDIIHAIHVGGKEYTLNWMGRAEPVKFGMTLSVNNILRGASYGDEIKVDVLRKNAHREQLTFQYVAPSPEDLPSIRPTYPNTATGKMDMQQNWDIAGVKLGALRAQHVEAFQMVDLVHPARRYAFQAVVLAVDQHSPAHSLLRPGMRILQVGDEQVANTQEGFLQQLQEAAQQDIFRITAGSDDYPVRFSISTATHN